MSSIMRSDVRTEAGRKQSLVLPDTVTEGVLWLYQGLYNGLHQLWAIEVCTRYM